MRAFTRQAFPCNAAAAAFCLLARSRHCDVAHGVADDDSLPVPASVGNTQLRPAGLHMPAAIKAPAARR